MLTLFAVILNIMEPSVPVECSSQTRIARLADGSYQRYRVPTDRECVSEARRYQEKWTNYPEKGGTFIKQITTGKDTK